MTAVISFAPSSLRFTEMLRSRASMNDILSGADGRPHINGQLAENFQGALDAQTNDALVLRAEKLDKARDTLVTKAQALNRAETALRVAVEKQAAAAIRKVPGGREEMTALGLMRRIAGVAVFPNPLAAGNRTGKTRVDGNLRLGLGIVGSAVAKYDPLTTDAEEAREKLALSMYDHTHALAAALGIKPGHLKRVVRAATVDETTVGLVIDYSVTVDGVKKFGTIVSNLEALPVMPLLDPALADYETLSLNDAAPEDPEQEEAPVVFDAPDGESDAADLI